MQSAKLQGRQVKYAFPIYVFRYLSLLVASQFGCLYIPVKITAQEKQIKWFGKLSSVEWDEEERLVPHLSDAIIARPARKAWMTSAVGDSTVIFAIRPVSRQPQ